MLPILYVTAGWLDLWSCRNFKSRFQTRAVVSHPADGFSISDRGQVGPHGGFYLNINYPSASSQKHDPVLKMTPSASSSWIFCPSSLPVTQQLSCKSQPSKGFHSQLVTPKNLYHVFFTKQCSYRENRKHHQ